MTHSPAAPAAGAVLPRRRPGRWVTLRETLIVMVVALALASALRGFVVQAFVVPSASMENTLLGGGPGSNDRIAVDKLPGQTVRRGQIVVFADPGGWLTPDQSTPGGLGGVLRQVGAFVGVTPDDGTRHLVKRVVGIGGDTVSCAGVGAPLTVDGVPLTEGSYLFPGSQPCSTTGDGIASWRYTVPAHELFVMGDNRDNSEDSRFHPADPFVPDADVTGRVVAVLYPLDRLRREPIPATFATIPADRIGAR